MSKKLSIYGVVQKHFSDNIPEYSKMTDNKVSGYSKGHTTHFEGCACFSQERINSYSKQLEEAHKEKVERDKEISELKDEVKSLTEDVFAFDEEVEAKDKEISELKQLIENMKERRKEGRK